MSVFQCSNRGSGCDVCKEILRTLKATVDASAYFNPGTLDEITSPISCDAHSQLLLPLLSTDGDEDPIEIITISKSHDSAVAIMFGMDSYGYCSSETRRLALVRRKEARGHVGHGILTKPDWIDTNRIRGWKSKCEVQHGINCQSTPGADWLLRITPIWLIDTWRQCLVPAQPEVPYLALSYVWGKDPIFMTLKRNLHQLQLDRALSTSEVSSRIPQTIKDAMNLVGILRERYLWVDSICIVQDEEEQKLDQINGMASIFANAHLTIIAEQGQDAGFGLRGLRGITQPRSYHQEVFKLGDGSEIIQTTQFRIKEASPWSQRGWTFQEHLFSRRRLIFNDDCARWECSCATWHEDIEETKDTRPVLSRIIERQQPFSTNFPDLCGYARVVDQYNTRQFSYPEDALAGFAGTAYAFSRTFNGGFACGLPTVFFDAALLWLPSGFLKRRFAVKTCGSTACLPSWSWVGWQGQISFWSFYNGCDYIKYCLGTSPSPSYTTQRTIPTTQWYSCKTISSARTPIHSTWYMYRTRFLNRHGALPTGWTRHDYQGVPDQGAKFPDHEPPFFFYKHESDSETEFWYPVPLCDPTQELSIRPNEGLLFCQTQRGWLYMGDRLQNDDHHTHCVSVRDRDGRWAGVLELHEPLAAPPQSQIPESNIVELVAISRGYAYDESSVITEWDHEERPKLNKKYEFYNVLWIKWEGGIAYRKSLGRIAKSVWEQQVLETIDLMLG